MGFDDKVDHTVDEMRGKAKEGLGKASDDEELAAEGRGEQTKADLGQAAEKAKDAFKH
jgi:uncharacterized protein YjbJ (UPF0337 family)